MANPYSLVDLACLQTEHSDERIIALSTNGGLTRTDFIRRVDDWQHFFSGMSGNRYALYFEDAAELASALWGAWHAGKIIILPGDRLPLSLEQLALLVDGMVGEMPSAMAAPVKGSASRSMPRSILDIDKTCLVIFTSGSSGEPSAIEKKISQLQAEVIALETSFGDMLGNSIIYGTVSHQHIYGLLFRVLWPLVSERCFYTQRLEYPEQIAKQLSGHPSVLIASPAHLKRLPENLDWHEMIADLRAVFSSGGPLSAESSDNVAKLWQCRPIEVFGSSETGGIAWRQSDDGSTSWQPLPGVEWQLMDEHLHIRSPHLSTDQWFVTHDRAALRDNNKFELLGRSDRIIKLEERRISLTAIEQCLLASEWIQECKLVVLPGQRERLAAVVILSAVGKKILQAKGKLSIVSELRAHLDGVIDPIAIPRHWRFLENMPCDNQGKTSQRLLAELFRMSLPPTKTLRHSGGSAQLEMAMSKDLIVFDGHFSQHAAVVPGVALIDWAIKHGRMLFSFNYSFLRLEALKFQQVIRPDSLINLDLDWNASKGILMFRYESPIGLHANGRILFCLPEGTSIQ
jgi:acyl-coenzyme A synthetase/AMP-(fatty) acid ligase